MFPDVQRGFWRVGVLIGVVPSVWKMYGSSRPPTHAEAVAQLGAVPLDPPFCHVFRASSVVRGPESMICGILASSSAGYRTAGRVLRRMQTFAAVAPHSSRVTWYKTGSPSSSVVDLAPLTPQLRTKASRGGLPGQRWLRVGCPRRPRHGKSGRAAGTKLETRVGLERCS